MSVEFYRESPGKFDSSLSRTTLSRWTGHNAGSFVVCVFRRVTEHHDVLAFNHSLSIIAINSSY